MDLGLKGKNVIVTGGASNIGRAIVFAFARDGANVVVADIDRKQAEKTAADALAAGAGKALATETDVTDPDSVAKMVALSTEAHGPIDVLVNNVGGTINRLFVEMSRADFEREIQFNLWSVINCTRAVLDGMIARGSGSIVSIGSDAGRMGEYRESVYAACKAGVIGLTKTLAREHGKSQIRFNVVCPGTTMPESEEDVGASSMWGPEGHLRFWNTPEMRDRISKLYPLRRIGIPNEVAAAVAFLSSDAASYITGQTLSASGGYTMM